MALATIYLIVLLIVQIIKRRRRFSGSFIKLILGVCIFLIFTIGFGYCMYKIPDVLYSQLPWSFIKVWAPFSIIIAIVLLQVTVTLFCLYFLLTVLFPKKDENTLFVISTLSILSGLGNAIIIFIINEAMNRTDGFQYGLLLYFFMGIVIYLFGQRFVMTNQYIYSKRIYLIDKLLSSSYEKFEQIENGKIHAGLNNDTETISNFANIVTNAVTSFVTLVCFL